MFGFFSTPIKKNMNVNPIISNFRAFQQENPNLKHWSVYFIYLRYNLLYTFSLAENTDLDSHKCMSGSILSNTSPPSQSFLSLLSLSFSLFHSLSSISLFLPLWLSVGRPCLFDIGTYVNFTLKWVSLFTFYKTNYLPIKLVKNQSYLSMKVYCYY